MRSKANTRKTGKEQYYTKSNVAIHCAQIASDFIGKNHTLVEPCVGTGEFVKALRSCGYDKIEMYDIEPKFEDVKPSSWFEVMHINKPFSIITNPPYGRMNSLSVQFFNWAAHLGAEYICFLIPISWRKWSTQDRLNDYYRLVKDVSLPDDYLFYGDDVDNTKQNVLKCVFQIWERSIKPRKRKKIKDNGYLTRTTPELADIQIVHQGWSCGKVNRDFDRNKNVNGTNYYTAEEGVIRTLEFLFQEDRYKRFKDNCAYVASISFEEINYLLNKIL